MFFTKVAAFIMSILMSFTSAFSFIPASIWFGKETYTVADSENILFDVALISDTHSDSSYFHERSKMMRKVFCGISQTDRVPDALVISGDVSNASDPKEYSMLQWSMNTFNKVENVLPSAGNHDVRARDTYEEALGYFTDFASFCGIETETVYYSAEVKGYNFIILGSDDKLSLEASISDRQLEWLESELVKAMESKKPVFIVCHQPLYNSNNVVYNPEAEKNYGVGEQSAQIEAILKKYVPTYECPVFFVNGHLHHDFDDYTVDGNLCPNLYCITLPSITKTADGGLGMAVEVYPDKVLLRARNYASMEWIEDYQYTIDY